MEGRRKQRSSIQSRTIDELMRRVSGDPNAIEFLIASLNEKGTIRFKAAKELQLISTANPTLLYPYFQVFVKLLDSSSSVLLWNGIIILSNLATVDTERRFDGIFDRYFAHLWDGKLVTAANILGSSGRIARRRPDMAELITQELLNADRIPLPTPECREVARGKVLAAFTDYFEILKRNRAADDFIARCTQSHRASVKKQAKALQQKMNPGDDSAFFQRMKNND
jgi:hypothetical protein